MRSPEQIDRMLDIIEKTLKDLTDLVLKDYEKRIAELEKQVNCDDGK